MTYLEKLMARRDEAVDQLAVIMAKPDYSVDGESYSWGAEKDRLQALIAGLNTLIQNAQPYCVTTRLFT